MSSSEGKVAKVNKLLASVVRYLVLLQTLVVVYAVFVRYFLRIPDIRAFFIATWFLGLIFLLCNAYNLSVGGHISVDIFYNKLPHRGRRFLLVVNLLALISTSIIILYVSIDAAIYSTLVGETDATSPIFAPPVWWYKWFVVISFLLFIAQSIELLYKSFRGGSA